MGTQGLTAAAITTHIARFAAMGTRVELHQFGAADDTALVAAQSAIAAVDDALTIHRPSPTTALNKTLLAGRTAPIDDPILFNALVEIDVAHALTYGLFDPAADRRFGGAGGDAITFDRRNARLSASQPLALDFGGFGKGMALDRACTVLRAAGVPSAFLSAGESSVAVIGEHPLGGGWPVSAPHPVQPDHVLVELELIDASLSISSTVGGRVAAPERAAMLRPGDKTIVTAARTAIVIDRSGARAEVLSTALIVADDDHVPRLLQDVRTRRFLFDFAGEAATLTQRIGMFA